MSYNPYSLENKTILVTGASSGIGKATAIECSKLGARLVITGRNPGRLEETAAMLEGTGHKWITGDLTEEATLKQLSDSVDSVDGLVNNAGIVLTRPVMFIKEKELDIVMKTNLYAPILLTKSLLKGKKLRKGASVVFTSSLAAYMNDPGNSMYCISKAGLSAYMRSCAVELADKGIRFNCVCPGMTETNLLQEGALSEEDLEKDMQRYPMKRYGKPEDIAYGIIYLLSDAAAWVTGSSLIIDGGISLK